jgi:hypothetical protein
MNNFFLLNEAIDLKDYDIFIEGMSELIVIKKSSNVNDVFFRHESIWNLLDSLGIYRNFGQTEQVILTYISQLIESKKYHFDEDSIDNEYKYDCNGFLGIEFQQLNISKNRQITNSSSYATFVNECNKKHAMNSIEDFWNVREQIFPKLVFCLNVEQQIKHLSANDDRFKLLFSKLNVLNKFTETWQSGVFNNNMLGLDNSPDTPTRVKDTIKLRTFNCPNIGPQVFSLHIKWYFGSEPFRLYFYPNSSDHKVYIGYIGAKDEIGF